MLRSWRERLLVGVSPSELTLVRMSGALRPRVTTKQATHCDPAFGSEPWHGAVAMLKDAAERLRGEALDLTIVLSNHFVRYALIPWNDALASTAEELAYARHCLAKIHGERSKSWTVSLSEEPAGMPRLAGAIDTALLEALRACFPTGDKARLISVQPYLMAAFNCWRARVEQTGAWLLLAEPERACIALYGKGHWQTVLNTRGSSVTQEDWAALLDRERHRVVDVGPAHAVLVHDAHGNATRSPRVGDWIFERLSLPPIDGYRPLEDGRYSMALSAGQT